MAVNGSCYARIRIPVSVPCPPDILSAEDRDKTAQWREADSSDQKPPIAIILNHPNDLAKHLDSIKNKSTQELHYFLKIMLLAEEEGLEQKIKTAKQSPFYPLYRTLSISHYQAPSLTEFMRYMIHNKLVTVSDRPLMRAMLKLCKQYVGMTVGQMMATVESQAQSDEDIKVFLSYRANSIEEHINPFTDDDSSDTHDSDEPPRRNGWFTRLTGKLLGLASSPLSRCFFMPLSAEGALLENPPHDKEAFNQSIPTSSQKKNLNDFPGGYPPPFPPLKESESKELCKYFLSKSSELFEAEDCGQLQDYYAKDCGLTDKFVCDTGQVIPAAWRCDGVNDCGDGSDEKVNGSQPICFQCDDDQLQLAETRCNGVNDCSDGSDEKVNGSQPICFQCDDDQLQLAETRCNGVNDCGDGSDELVCNTTSATVLITSLVVVGVTVAGTIYYVVKLIQYKDKRTSKGIMAWLVSPFTCCSHRYSKANTEAPEGDENEKL